MHNYLYDELDELKRKLDGKPPRKETTLPPSSTLNANQVVNGALRIMAKNMKDACQDFGRCNCLPGHCEKGLRT